MRPADASDIRLLFDWRNDPWIVSLSTSKRAVTWEEHEAWFESVLDHSRHLVFIVLSDDGIPAGSLRLDLNNAEAVISIHLARSYTGIGLGPRAIEVGCRRAFEHWPTLSRIIAYIRNDNQSSIKAFTRASFRPSPGETSCPQDHVALVHGRDDS